MRWEINIRVLDGPATGKQYLFRKKEITIGRGKHADISLTEDGLVSRDHLVVRLRKKKRMEVVSRGRSGTFFNGNPVHRMTLPYGAKLHMGDSVVQLGDEEMSVSLPLKMGRTPESKKRPALTIYVLILGIAALLCIMLLKTFVNDPAPSIQSADPRQLITMGSVAEAVSILKERVNSGHISENDEELYTFALSLNDKWTRCVVLESRMQWDTARDGWNMIAITLPDDWGDLRAWIQEHQIDRLEKKIRDAR